MGDAAFQWPPSGSRPSANSSSGSTASPLTDHRTWPNSSRNGSPTLERKNTAHVMLSTGSELLLGVRSDGKKLGRKLQDLFSNEHCIMVILLKMWLLKSK